MNTTQCQEGCRLLSTLQKAAGQGLGKWDILREGHINEPEAGVSSTFIMADIDADATGLFPMHACIGTLNCCRGMRSLSLLQMIFPEI